MSRSVGAREFTSYTCMPRKKDHATKKRDFRSIAPFYKIAFLERFKTAHIRYMTFSVGNPMGRNGNSWEVEKSHGIPKTFPWDFPSNFPWDFPNSFPVFRIVSHCFPTHPKIFTLSQHIPLFPKHPIVSHCFPFFPTVSRRIPPFPKTSHCCPLFPILSRCFPTYATVSQNIPLLPIVSHYFPIHPTVSQNI